MSNITATVTPRQIYTPDAENKIQLTKDTLNDLGNPQVSVPLTNAVATADIQANAVTYPKIASAVQAALRKIAITVGSENSDTLDCDIAVQDMDGTAVASYFVITCWLSDTPYAGPTSSSPATSFQVATLGTQLDQPVSGKMIVGVTGSGGVLRVRLNHTGGGASQTWYLNAELNGVVYTSTAITITI